MDKNDSLALMVLLGIIAISLMGGTKGIHFAPLISTNPPSTNTTDQQVEIQKQINDTKTKVEDLKVKVQAEEDLKTHSPYYGLVNINFVNRSSDPAYEYMVIQASQSNTSPVKVSGWTIKSLASGQSITVPKASYLYFAGGPNSDDDIYLSPGDTLYLITGKSPNGASFKWNKCSGYLNQFQTFTPYISTSCPAPGKEDLSSIPKTVNNDACLDYISYFPSCKIQTETLPQNWSYECTHFIYSKINYPSCIATHKNDADFYMPYWQVYLGRSERLWKDWRENIIIYDTNGKVVDDLAY